MVAFLSSQFRELQKPVSSRQILLLASERDKLLAVQKAAQINDAYQVLKKPISAVQNIYWSLHEVDIRAEHANYARPYVPYGTDGIA